MTIETALYPNQLNTALPASSDFVSEGDDHLRLIKTVVKTTFPNVAGAVNASQTELNYSVGVTSGIQTQINTKGAIAGQTWTGTHVFPSTTTVGPLTPAIQANLATVTSDAQAQINSKGAIAGQIWSGTHVFPSTTTVGPLAPTIQTSLSTVTSDVQAQINTKGAITGQNWSGTHSFPSTTTVGPLTPAIQGYLSTATSPIQAQINSKAAKAGDTYTGTHDFTGGALKAPTMTAGTATTDVATTAFVASAAFSTALPGQTGNAGKVISTDGTNASWVQPVFLTPYANTATATTAVPYGRYRLTASLNLTLPASPADGVWVDVVNTSGTTTARVLRNGQNINGLAEDLTIDKNFAAFRLVFRTGYGWMIA